MGRRGGRLQASALRAGMMGAALGAAACSHDFPIAVVGPSVPGGIMRGTGTAALDGGRFSVSSGSFVCAGNYDAMDMSPTITIPILCNDGRKGTVVAIRNSSGMGGTGTFRLTDGTAGDVMFGQGAEKL